MYHIPLVVLSMVTLCVYVNAQTQEVWTPDNYPNPQTQPTKCGRPASKRAWVCDPNGIITYDEARVLDYMIEAIAHKGATKCPCSAYECDRNGSGYKISVALMKKMKIEKINKKDSVVEVARRFAYRLMMEKWKFARCEENVVIVFSRDDNILYVMSGDTAKLKLTDEYLKVITDHSGPYFAKGRDVSVGLKTMVIHLRNVFNDNFYKDAVFEVHGRGRSAVVTFSFLLVLACLSHLVFML